MRITSEINVDLPKMPNFLKGRFGTTIDDAHDVVTIDIATLTPEYVEEYIAAYAEAFRDHWRKRKALEAEQSSRQQNPATGVAISEFLRKEMERQSAEAEKRRRGKI